MSFKPRQDGQQQSNGSTDGAQRLEARKTVLHSARVIRSIWLPVLERAGRGRPPYPTRV